ncbi:MAG: cold shock domain-containing protein [Bacteroidetes bacterium]|nr:cold shock domain-containing protein [Bacteroidota bacterium]
MLKGIVQFYLSDKKYGYIRVSDTREEFFFSGRKLAFTPQKGEEVQFELKEDKQGLKAINIKLSTPSQ